MQFHNNKQIYLELILVSHNNNSSQGKKAH